MMKDEAPPRKIYKQPNLSDVWPAAAAGLPPHEQRALALFVDLFVEQAKGRSHWLPDDWAALRLIRLVFLVDWDPIGVFEHLGADDEYDEYVPGFYRLLLNPAGEEELTEYLRRIEDEQMRLNQREPHLSRRVARRQEAVRKIRSCYANLLQYAEQRNRAVNDTAS